MGKTLAFPQVGAGAESAGGLAWRDAQKHGTCQTRGPTPAVPTEVRGARALFSSRTFGVLLKTAPTEHPSLKAFHRVPPGGLLGEVHPFHRQTVIAGSSYIANL